MTNQTNNLEGLPDHSETVVLTLSLSQDKTLKLNVIPPESSGIKLQPWELLGMLESAKQLVLTHYFNTVGTQNNVDRSTTN